MAEYPDQTAVINDIQRSEPLKRAKTVAFVCAAVQAYYKRLNEIGAIRNPKSAEETNTTEAPKSEKPLNKMNKDELLAKCTELGIEANEEITNAELIELIETKK